MKKLFLMIKLRIQLFNLPFLKRFNIMCLETNFFNESRSNSTKDKANFVLARTIESCQMHFESNFILCL